MMTDPQDELTVVIAAFNSQSTIGSAIDGAKRLLGCRVIVVDDGSSDNTAELALHHGAEVLRQENQGAAAARRAGLALADTRLVVILDGDDLVAPGMLMAIKLMRSDKGIAVVGGRIELASRKGATGVLGPAPADEYFTEDLLRRPSSPWPPSASVWDRSALEANLSLPIPLMETEYAEDYELLIRASLVGRVLAVPDTTCVYASYGGKSSGRALDALKCAERIRIVYAKIQGIPIEPWSSAALRRLAAWRLFRARSTEFGIFRGVLWALHDRNLAIDLSVALSHRVWGRAESSRLRLLSYFGMGK